MTKIEAGRVRIDLVDAAILLAAVGLRLSVRAYPAGEPIRDAGHAALLARLRGRLSDGLRWRLEVPLPIAGDLRAWDATIEGRGWAVGVEAETRPRDLQALLRRLALKRRDAGMAEMILLLGDTRHVRTLIRLHEPELRAEFPMPGGRALEQLASGLRPGGSAVVLL